MAITEFYVNSSGSDLNSGTTCSDVSSGSNTAIYTSTSGNFDGTSVFTPTDSSTPASTVSVGMYVSLYNTGDSNARCIAQVTAVGAGVNGTITISTTVKYGTVPTSNSGSRNLRCGGAFAAFLYNNLAFTTGTLTQSTRVNIKAGTYSQTSAGITFALSGTAVIPMIWRGYQNTPGDQDTNLQAVAGTNIPSITFTTGQFLVTGSYINFMNLNITGATTTGGGQLRVNGSDNFFINVRSTNTAANAASVAFQSSNNIGTALGCSFIATTTATECVYAGTSSQNFIGCYIKGGVSGIYNNTNFPILCQNCIFDSQGTDGILAVAAFVLNCGFYNQGGNGCNFTASAADAVFVVNCYFENITGGSKAAINNTNASTADNIHVAGNTFYNCTANYAGFGDGMVFFDNGSLASAGFVNASGGNFSATPLLWGKGFPSVFPTLTSFANYGDVGAVQHQGQWIINKITNNYFLQEDGGDV